MEYHYDVLVIGAGLAGITAADTIEKHNRGDTQRPLSYAVLEASDRLGGRVKSDMIVVPGQKPIKIERGAQWLHADIREGAAPNPLIPYAKAAGIELIPDSMPREFFKSGQRQNYNGKIRLIKTARQLIDGHSGADTDVQQLFDTNHLCTDSALKSTYGPVETGAPLCRTSVIDLQQLVACNRGDFTRQPLSGMVDHMASGVRQHIKLNCPIQELHWKLEGREGGMVKLKNGDTYFAKRIIASPSVGVLRSGDIRIIPPLPPAHQHSLDNIHMGDFNKVFIVFDKGFRMPVNSNTHMDVETREGHDLFYLARDNGQQLVTTFMGDDLARECDHNPEKAKTLAINALAEIWGQGIKNHIMRDKCLCTQWGQEAHVKGGYSRVNIGHHGARQQLAEPIGDTLYLAGEGLGAISKATGQNWGTHMAGAHISGQRAAEMVCQSLSVQSSVTPQNASFAQRLR